MAAANLILDPAANFLYNTPPPEVQTSSRRAFNWAGAGIRIVAIPSLGHSASRCYPEV